MLIPFDQLFARYQIKSQGCLHLGANEGQEAEAYHKHGISRVIWVEALPDVHSKLKIHIARFPGSLALLACVSDKDGEKVVFNVASNEGQSSSFLEFGTHSKEHPTVKYVSKLEMTTIRVDSLLKKNKVEIPIKEDWFLNIDLQGAELLALKGMGDLLFGFRYAYIEVNIRQLYKGCPLVGEIDDYLKEFGFVAVETKMTNWGWGDCFYQRKTL